MTTSTRPAMILRSIWIAAFLGLLRAAIVASELKVVGVHDGDTITILDGKVSTRIRLEGIDAPELGQPFGTASKQWLAARIYGKVITVAGSKSDRYGRWLRIVYVDKQNVNLESVGAGMSWWYEDFAQKDIELKDAESNARSKKKGLWSDEQTPIAPWNWRKNERESSAVPPKSDPSSTSRQSSEPDREVSQTSILTFQATQGVLIALVTLLPWYGIAVLLSHLLENATKDPAKSCLIGATVSTVAAIAIAGFTSSLFLPNLGSSLITSAQVLLLILLIVGFAKKSASRN